MEVTQAEWANWRDVMVAEEARDRWERFEDWVARQNAEVVWDGAARQNQRARDMEDSRFAEEFQSAASEARQRARWCAQRSMRSVK